MSQVRSSSILVHMQKGVSILCRVDHFANTLNTFGGCAYLNLHRHKKTGRPPDCFPLSTRISPTSLYWKRDFNLETRSG